MTMAAMDESSHAVFSYVAQTLDGQRMSGTIDAVDADDAVKRLEFLKLRIIRIDPAPPTPRAKPLSGEDFTAFNQQLAHLTGAGLPIEQGLRLIAEDMRDERLAQSIRDVSAELERGVPLGDAFKRHEKQFPPLYGVLIDAGVRTGNLTAVLLNLGRHLELVARLRAAVWRAAAYPLTVLAGLLVVMIFLGHFVLPQFEKMYEHWYTPLPKITQVLFVLTQWTPVLIVVALVLFFGAPLLWLILRSAKLDAAAADLALPLPLVGPVLRRNLIARWCDAMQLAVQSGMDLPAAVNTACNVVGSPALGRDCEKIVEQMTAARPLDEISDRLRVLPPTVVAVVQLSTDRGDLPNSLKTLASMYQQQAELRLTSVQSVLTPLLILMVAALIAMVVLALFAPIISIFRLWS